MLGGCSVTPEYRKPATDLPASPVATMTSTGLPDEHFEKVLKPNIFPGVYELVENAIATAATALPRRSTSLPRSVPASASAS